MARERDYGACDTGVPRVDCAVRYQSVVAKATGHQLVALDGIWLL